MIEVKDLTGLSEPASKLIDKISDAIGGIAKPWQIVRTAQAEAQAELIKAETAIAVSHIEKRALERFVSEEIQKQANIETITHKALDGISPDADPDRIDNDWIVNFFEKCRIISNKEMQLLWAKILSTEANRPGHFSRKTVNLLADIEKPDAEAFSRLCMYCWDIGGPVPLIFDFDDEIYTKNDVGFNEIIHLETLGLVQFIPPPAGFTRRGFKEECSIYYHQRSAIVTLPATAKGDIRVGHVLFTKAGYELFEVCEHIAVDGFFEYAIAKLMSHGYKSKE